MATSSKLDLDDGHLYPPEEREALFEARRERL
jgi:hypothetical protein